MRNAERRKLDQYLVEIRRELFDRPEPPFHNLSEAEDWLRVESGRGGLESGGEERRREFFARLEVIKADVQSLGRLAPRGLHLRWGLHRDLISFYTDRERAVSRVPATTAMLQRIAEVARYGAEFGDVSDANITARLLVGWPFATGRESKRWITNPIGTSTTTSVRRDRDVREWQAATESPKLKLRDRELLRFVLALQDSGAPPPTAPGRRGQDAGVRKYWEDVLREWNLGHTQDWHYGHWTSVRRRYEQIVSHLPERPLL